MSDDDEEDEVAAITNEDHHETHLMVAALCALYLRDAIVLSGREDVAGALSDSSLRIEYLRAAAKLAEVAEDDIVDRAMLELESDDALRGVIGVPLIYEAARTLAAYKDIADGLAAIGAKERRERAERDNT